MKKIIATLALVCVVAANCFAPEVESRTLPPNLNLYIKTFTDGVVPQNNRVRIARKYYQHVTADENVDAVAPFAQIEGDPDEIDTVLEWLYVSNYHVAVRDIRPPEAKAILPAENPKLVDQIIGAETFRDIQIARFLGNTETLGRYEGGLKIITGRGNATRAEIEKFYRDNVRSLIVAVVDEEFNKVSFMIDRNYNAILIRNPQNGQYKLSYEGVIINNETRVITANSLETLSSAMSKSGDFSNTAFDTVRALAALIPAVARPSELEKTKTAVTNFLLTPSDSTYSALTSLYNTYVTQPFLRNSFLGTLSSLNSALAMRIVGR